MRRADAGQTNHSRAFKGVRKQDRKIEAFPAQRRRTVCHLAAQSRAPGAPSSVITSIDRAFAFIEAATQGLARTVICGFRKTLAKARRAGSDMTASPIQFVARIRMFTPPVNKPPVDRCVCY